MKTDGIDTELQELIALERFAKASKKLPNGRASHAGRNLSKFRGRGMDFSEVRNYQSGDEIRHMEWRVTARTGKPHIKLYQEERERPVVLLIDFNPSMFFGTRIAFKSVVAARLAAMLAWTTVKQGDKVGGLLFSQEAHHELTPKARKAGVLHLLQCLSDYTKKHPASPSQSVQRPLSDVLLKLRRVTKPGSTIVLISDFYQMDDACTEHLNQLKMHNDILCYHICDPLELKPPQPNQYAISNGTQDLILDTTDKPIFDTYQAYFEGRESQLKSICSKLNMQYAQVTPETNLPLLLAQTFPRRSHG